MYLLNDAVVSEWSAPPVHLTIPPLVDQLTNGLQVGIPVSNKHNPVLKQPITRLYMCTIIKLTPRQCTVQPVVAYWWRPCWAWWILHCWSASVGAAAESFSHVDSHHWYYNEDTWNHVHRSNVWVYGHPLGLNVCVCVCMCVCACVHAHIHIHLHFHMYEYSIIHTPLFWWQRPAWVHLGCRSFLPFWLLASVLSRPSPSDGTL